MEQKVLCYPEPRLRAVAAPVPGITAEIRRLAEEMFGVMNGAHGIGLAAPQVGVGLRLFVASIVPDGGQEPRKEAYVNPVIVARGGKVREEEGCLSFPDLFTPVERFEDVTVEYVALGGESRRVTAAGMHARVLQHEIDHLDGVLIIDRMSPAEKKRWAQLVAGLEEQFAAGRGPAGAVEGASAGRRSGARGRGGAAL